MVDSFSYNFWQGNQLSIYLFFFVCNFKLNFWTRKPTNHLIKTKYYYKNSFNYIFMVSLELGSDKAGPTNKKIWPTTGSRSTRVRVHDRQETRALKNTWQRLLPVKLLLLLLLAFALKSIKISAKSRRVETERLCSAFSLIVVQSNCIVSYNLISL